MQAVETEAVEPDGSGDLSILSMSGATENSKDDLEAGFGIVTVLRAASTPASDGLPGCVGLTSLAIERVVSSLQQVLQEGEARFAEACFGKSK